MRTHVMLPEELVAELDAHVERRGRSAFVEAAVRERLLRLRQLRALRESAGALAGDVSTELATPERTSAWVRTSRALEARRGRAALA